MAEPNYLAFDIETTKEFPDGDDWRDHRPLGIACAAAYSPSLHQPVTWYTTDADGIAYQMSQGDLTLMVGQLQSLAANGYTIVSWNGLGFDFDVLAEESGMEAECRDLALNHIDMMFHLYVEKGHPLALSTAAEGMNTAGKTEGMDGALALKMWAEGQRDVVIDYCSQDVVATYQLAQECQKRQSLNWTSRSGRRQALRIPTGWATVSQALKLPSPDTSWMTEPIPREAFTAWLNRAQQQNA